MAENGSHNKSIKQMNRQNRKHSKIKGPDKAYYGLLKKHGWPKALTAWPLNPLYVSGHGNHEDMEDSNEKSDGFRYIDFASDAIENFRNNIIPVSFAGDMINHNRASECYVSCFLYPDEILDYMQDNLVKGRPSVSGYKGPHYAYFLPIDIDSKGNPEKARRAAVRAVNILGKDAGIDRDLVLLYFSGNKGFHLMADSRPFGVKSGERLNMQFTKVRKELSKRLGEDGRYIDQKIGDSVRLWRVPNTINKKSGLYKVQLTYDELIRYDISKIRGLASMRRRIFATDRSGLLPSYDADFVSRAGEFYKRAIEANGFNNGNNRKINYGSFRINEQGMCPAKLRIYNSKIPEGDRNNCALILASYFRESGQNVDSARTRVLEWNQRNHIGLNESEIERVVESAYGKERPYVYGCLSLEDYCPYPDRSKCRFLIKSFFGKE